jgi:hypothetical protein
VLAKVQDWLAASSAAVWVADPRTETVTTCGPNGKAVVLKASDALSGGGVLPGFRAPMAGIIAMQRR